MREILKETPWSSIKIYTKEDINAWIEFMKDEKNIPAKRGKQERKEFPVEFAPDCEFPDTTFTLYFPSEVSKGLEDKVDGIFVNIMELYNISHKNTIHDVSNAKDIYPDSDKNSIPMMVDFANCNPKAINEIIKGLEYTDLEIVRLVIS